MRLVILLFIFLEFISLSQSQKCPSNGSTNPFFIKKTVPTRTLQVSTVASESKETLPPNHNDKREKVSWTVEQPPAESNNPTPTQSPLDFFSNHTPSIEIMHSSSPSTASPMPSENNSKKERFNFASFDCGALFLASNPGSREGSAIIQNTKDRYMLNKCSTPSKWVEIEFCEEILVESIQLANYELFSSTFKEFKVYVNNKYPPTIKDPWLLLGKFTAKNIRGKQIFHVENPLIWAKYLRLEFLTHYGTEYYCPFSQIKVFGTTMMEEVQKEEKITTKEAYFPSPIPEHKDTSLLQAPIQTQSDLKLRKVSKSSLSAQMSPICERKVPFDASFTLFQEFYCALHPSQEDQQRDNVNEPRNKVIQESIFKNIIKRLNALEESSSSTLEGVKAQKETIEWLVQNHQERVYEVPLDKEGKIIHEKLLNGKKKLDHLLLEILQDQEYLKKRLDFMTQSIETLKQEHFLFQLIIQILFALVIVFGRYFLTSYFSKPTHASLSSSRIHVKPQSSVTGLMTPNSTQCPKKKRKRRRSLKDHSAVSWDMGTAGV